MSSEDPQALWETLRIGLSTRLPERTFQDWIEPCRALTYDGTMLWIQTPSTSARVWIEQQLAEEFHDVIVQSGFHDLRLAFTVAGEVAPAKTGGKAKSAVHTQESEAADSFFPQGFNRYTLDRFVVGPSSQLAFAAANAVVESHGKLNTSLNMNPLFIYGASGLGKTHLMIGIGKGLLTRSPGLKVAYLKVDNFFNELTVAIKAKNTEPMRKKYQQNDVLLLDDVQTLGKMERTQEEIFYILEYLLQYGKQIVITSDKPPQKLEGLHDRLVTRCKWGLTADIQPPDFETRVAILNKKLEDEVFRDMPIVPEDVLTFIAHKAKGSVRDLEGLLTRVVFQSSFLGVPPSLEVAQQAYQGHSGQEASSGISLERICRMTAETFNISFNDLMKKKSRQQTILLPRQVAMYLARELTGASFSDIGRSFNNMHHSTVMNAIDSVKARMHKNSDFHKVLHSLLNSIG
jgi:chromosomal replication initiator protein